MANVNRYPFFSNLQWVYAYLTEIALRKEPKSEYHFTRRNVYSQKVNLSVVHDAIIFYVLIEKLFALQFTDLHKLFITGKCVRRPALTSSLNSHDRAVATIKKKTWRRLKILKLVIVTV